jgi:hypothetical protein
MLTRNQANWLTVLGVAGLIAGPAVTSAVYADSSSSSSSSSTSAPAPSVAYVAPGPAAPKATLNADGSLTITFPLTNIGSDTASAVTITSLQAFGQPAGIPLTVTSPAVPLSLGDLAAGASTSLTVTVTLPAPGNLAADEQALNQAVAADKAALAQLQSDEQALSNALAGGDPNAIQQAEAVVKADITVEQADEKTAQADYAQVQADEAAAVQAVTLIVQGSYSDQGLTLPFSFETFAPVSSGS